jgi:hypothetical protein
MKSDSLDNISLDSDDIRTIERFENNYYNRKNNILQNGGSNKLEKNIVRLFNCYVLSLNQNGGAIIHDDLSSQIKQRLNKKIVELSNDFIGGYIFNRIFLNFASDKRIKDEIIKEITSYKDVIIQGIITSLETVILEINNSDIEGFQKILKGPSDYYQYKLWLYEQITNWINNKTNKNEIFDQILKYIKMFIDAPSTEVAVTTKAPQKELPTLLERHSVNTHPVTHFWLNQAPYPVLTALQEAEKKYRSR